jgi:hypothetical protein
MAGLFGVVTVASARAGVGTPSVAGAECKRTHRFGAREQDDNVLHRVKRESVASVDVGNKLLVDFLVARCVREVEAHEGDEGEDVLNRHGGYAAELRHACVNGRDVVSAGSRGVVLATETRLEAVGKELVRNGSTCNGVQEKDFCPCIGTTVRRAGFDFYKHPVKRSKGFGLLLEELPKAVMEYGFRGFAIAGESGETHVGRLLVGGQCGPFNNGEHDEPHVGRPEFFDEGFTKGQKVPGIFDALACGDNGKDRYDLSFVPCDAGGARAAWRSTGAEDSGGILGRHD